MKWRARLAIAIFLILLSACSKPINERSNNLIESRKNVTVKAGIVYRIGGVQPVARTTFYLSKDDLLTLSQKTGKNLKIGVLGAMADIDVQLKGRATTFEELVKPNAISSMTTDFEGTGKFENVPTGTYYLIGITQTRSGVAIWNVKVNAGDNIILDQNNAAYTS